ncbi:hypothetical protein C0992_005926 [Termitomyces sp. T32_za158]|nr:hypothetical protein C0992_005926 [Termitomyces sp. T32_za158]
MLLIVHTHLMMLDELSQGEEGTWTKRRGKRPPKPRARIAKSPLVQHNHTVQRRHVSFAMESTPAPATELPAVSKLTKHEHRIQRFQRMIQLPRSELDLQHAWGLYEKIEQYRLPIPTIMSFLEKYISAVELRYGVKPSGDSDDGLAGPAENALKVLDDLKLAITPASRFDQWRLCLLARALALRGDYEGATNAIDDAGKIELPFLFKAGIVSAYDMILTSLVRYEGNSRAMEFIGDHWETLSKYMRYKIYGPSTAPFKRVVDSLKATATRIAAEITEPSFFLEKEDWDKKRRENVGCFFIQALSNANFSTEGCEVYSRMQRLNLNVPRQFQFMLIRSLALRPATMHSAIDMYQSTHHTQDDLLYERLGVYLYARQGDVETFEGCFNRLKAMTSPIAEDIASLIHGYAMANDAQRAEETFEEFFPYGANGKRLNSPGIPHYAAVINAHARKEGNSQKEISFWLTDLAKADQVPNEYVFTIVLNAFAAAGDLDSTMNVLQEMRKAGIKPNVVTYTIVITLLAHRKDPLGAEAVFKRALKEGIVPDNRMIVALMNAHVEGGSWKGVIRAYDYIMAARVTALSLEVYNTLMKAYVLIGAPFTVVYNFFQKLERSKAKPDAYTYALLVQSACDAGLMSIAADIYYDLKESKKPGWNVDVNVFILTILMAGFLQHGDKVRAHGVYKEITELGINPSPITLRTILESYGHEMSKESMEIAEEFVKSLVEVPEEERTWKKPKYDSLSALQHLYGPVLAGWSRMDLPEDVERVIQDLQDSGEEPSIGNLTRLLDVYRRTFNIDAVMEIWPKIQELGVKITSREWMLPQDGPPDSTRGIRGNVLCVPLSIYIDALSAAGLHSEIAKIWKDLRSRGFSFDSHNWNHLSVAMVRAGEVERAFEVVERVIIPYQELSITYRRKRDSNPSSPLLSDVVKESQEEDEEDEVPSVPALRGHTRRGIAKQTASKTEGLDVFKEDSDHSDDPAYHLHILHQISPSWSVWMAHKATISILLMALNRLREGKLMRAIGATTEHYDEDEPRKAREVLQRIYEKYPKTVQLVLDLDDDQRQMLTTDKYNELYNLT